MQRLGSGLYAPNNLGQVSRGKLDALEAPETIDDLVLWLRSDEITGLSNGDPIATWPDKSALGYNATMTGDFRPEYVASGLNSLPTVRFDGVDERMIVDADIVDVSFSGVSEGTLFAVFTVSGGDTQWGIVEINEANDAFWRFSDGTSYSGVFRALGARAGGIVTAQPTSGSHYHTIRSGPANAYDYRRNGSLDGETAANWGVATPVFIGFENVTNWFTGDVSEVIIYKRELLDAEVSSIESYIATRYGL